LLPFFKALGVSKVAGLQDFFSNRQSKYKIAKPILGAASLPYQEAVKSFNFMLYIVFLLM